MLIKITKGSRIPLYGLDFIGVIDRGTSLIEVRPTTLCNLRCAYCYASAGELDNEFEVEPSYLLDAFEQVARFKRMEGIEAHIDPYGEGFLYKPLMELISGLKCIPGVSRVSMQSNGTLITRDGLDRLKRAGLDQINITLNTIDEAQAKKLSCREEYDLQGLLKVLQAVPEYGIDLVITPVWFFGVNDAGIEEVINFYKDLKSSHPVPTAVRIGIQNYLVYRTGRKLGKVREREFGHFYKQLRALEKKHRTKLVLSAKDFGIRPSRTFPSEFISSLQLARGKKQVVDVEVVAPGRNKREIIGSVAGWGMKILNFSSAVINPGNEPRAHLAMSSADFDITQDFLVTATLR